MRLRFAMLVIGILAWTLLLPAALMIRQPPATSESATAGAGSGNGSNGRDGAPPASGTASGRGATASGPVARAADLRSPELSVSRSNDGAGLGWLLWLLVLSVPVGALALYAWMRHARRAGVAGLEPDST